MPKAYVIASLIIAVLLIGLGAQLMRQGRQGIQPATDQLQEESSLTSEGNTTSTNATSATNSPSPSTSHTITYDGTRYTPSNLTIKTGTTVTFVNNSSRQFWPASDPHPIHTKYGDFDANRGLASGQSYSFTFDKKGSWGFHDHLNASAKGTIVVE